MSIGRTIKVEWSLKSLVCACNGEQEEALFDEMKEIQAAVRPDNIIFVMDATQGMATASHPILHTQQETCAPGHNGAHCDHPRQNCGLTSSAQWLRCPGQAVYDQAQGFHEAVEVGTSAQSGP